MEGIIVSTGYSLEGYRILNYIGITKGLSRLKTGLLTDYGIENLSDQIEEAISKMKENAISLGANAVIGVQIQMFVISGQGVYHEAIGTAVTVENRNTLSPN